MPNFVVPIITFLLISLRLEDRWHKWWVSSKILELFSPAHQWPLATFYCFHCPLHDKYRTECDDVDGEEIPWSEVVSTCCRAQRGHPAFAWEPVFSEPPSQHESCPPNLLPAISRTQAKLTDPITKVWKAGAQAKYQMPKTALWQFLIC